MNAQTPIVEIANATKSFGTFTALHNIDLKISAGEIVTLLGPSGCGKTTLMRMIAGFVGPTTGTIRINGADMARVPPEHRPVNMVFQRYALFPHLDVFDNVAFGLKVKGMPKEEIRTQVQRMLAIVQLESFSSRYIDELSGGQCQRVALARALVNRPKVLLLDEPLAALDLKIRQHMLTEIKRIHAETGTTFVYVTHDQDEAMVLSDRIVLLEKGRIVQIDQPEAMYARPRTLFAAKFLGETNLLDAKMSNTAGTEAVTATGIRFAAPNATEGLSGDVVVSIRPEQLHFLSNTDAPDAQMEGVIEDIVFIGSRTFFSVRMAGDQSVRVQVQRSSRAGLPGLGDAARIGWDSQNVVLLAKG